MWIAGFQLKTNSQTSVQILYQIIHGYSATTNLGGGKHSLAEEEVSSQPSFLYSQRHQDEV